MYNVRPGSDHGSGSVSYTHLEIEIGSDLRMNQEYSLQITLDTSEGEVYYLSLIHI